MLSAPPFVPADAALAPLQGDSEDVAWALSAVATLLERGERPEALKWLRRAGAAAEESGHDERAVQLFKRAAELASWLQQQPAANGSAGHDCHAAGTSEATKTPLPSPRASTNSHRSRSPALSEPLEQDETDSILPEAMVRRALLALDPGHTRKETGDPDNWENRPYPVAPAEESPPPHAATRHSRDHEEPLPSAAEVPSSMPAPAQRVAVMAVPETGDVRIVFLEKDQPAPAGGAEALLVAPSRQDAKLIAQVRQEVQGSGPKS